MPVALKKWFKQNGDIAAEVVTKLATSSFGVGVTDTAVKFDWDGRPVATVGLELSPDNRRVIRARLLLLGLFTKEPVTVPANKLFPDADPSITMSITVPDGAAFRFNDGTTASDLLACENFKHHFAKDGNVILPTDWAANKLGETSMRALCHLDKNSNAAPGPRPKTTILLFPRSADDMIQLSDNTQNPAWPGLRILQSTSEFFPKIPEWKDPICPLLLLGSLFNEAPNVPSHQELQFHIAAVMKSARLPTACTSGKGLLKQWSKALTDVESLEKEPSVTWPDVTRPTVATGKFRPTSFFGSYASVFK
jgi:hypothetical protein